jgi:hypothetical protein
MSSRMSASVISDSEKWMPTFLDQCLLEIKLAARVADLSGVDAIDRQRSWIAEVDKRIQDKAFDALSDAVLRRQQPEIGSALQVCTPTRCWCSSASPRQSLSCLDNRVLATAICVCTRSSPRLYCTLMSLWYTCSIFTNTLFWNLM